MLPILLTAFLLAALAAYVTWRVRRDDVVARAVVALMVFLAATGVGRAVMKPRLEEAARMEIPFYRAIKAHEPQLYAQLKDNGTNQLALLASVRADTAKLLAKYTPSASDESLRQFLLISTEVMESLARANADDVHGVFVPGGRMDLSKLRLPDDVVKRELDALAEIVRTGATLPRRDIDARHADQLLENVAMRAWRGSGDGVISQLENTSAPAADRSRGMQAIAAYYRNILNLPAADRAVAIRRLLTRNNGELR